MVVVVGEYSFDSGSLRFVGQGKSINLLKDLCSFLRSHFNYVLEKERRNNFLD